MALCVVLARLVYPGRWPGLQHIFGKSVGWMSSVFTDVILHISRSHRDLLGWHPQFTYDRLEAYADGTFFAIGMEDIWGFVDSTFRAFCKPGSSDEAQRAAYSGHKKQHGQNWQAIVTPDGLVSSLVDPYLGPAND